MKHTLLIAISTVSIVHAKVIDINTNVSTLIELRNNYYNCVYDDQSNCVVCSKNQTAPSDLPLTITFDAKDGISIECSLGLNDERELVGTYHNNNTICAISITRRINTDTDQTTDDEWIESYQEQ